MTAPTLGITRLLVLLALLLTIYAPATAEKLEVPCKLDDGDGDDGACTCETSLRRLSVPDTTVPEYASSARVRAIAEAREQISNGPRTIVIAGEHYPMYYGPRATPGSITVATQLEEFAKLKTFRTAYLKLVAGIAVNHSDRLSSLDGYASLNEQTSGVIERSMCTDNSDETFGPQRLSIKSFALREATREDFVDQPLVLSDWQLIKRCGLAADALLLTHALFVEDFHDIAQYNDLKRPHKYVPNVVGFFCVHFETQQLLPIEIRLLDTKLAYTPLDTEDEWTLAKMALEVASVCYHQMQHMVETHSMTVPLRVEAMRTMSEEHPVRALLQRHVYADFVVEMQAAVLLLNTSTATDETFGWGGNGAARFVYAQTQRGVSITRKNAFHADLRTRGLDRIHTYKYARDASLYWTAMLAFVSAFLVVYYLSDDTVKRDGELQSWANAYQTIPHVKDFPTRFRTKRELADLLTHATWHGMNAPYSPGALWKPLPTEKLAPGQTLDVLAYTAPPKVLPIALALGANFIRRVPESENMIAAYKSEPFRSEPRLQGAIAAFDAALEHIDQTIVAREAGSKWPYHMLRPKGLAHYIWI